MRNFKETQTTDNLFGFMSGLISQEPIYVIGHINPDTDSICSAMAYVDLKAQLQQYNYIACRLGEINRETRFVLDYFDVPGPALIENVSGKSVVLVDHNEEAQSAKGRVNAKIIEIIDHHRIANLETFEPIYITMEPLGSTASIIFKKYLDNKLLPSKEMAGLLLSAVLSDTLVLTSPSCTNEDKYFANNLSGLAEIKDYEAFGLDILKAGAALEGLTAEEILATDRKKYIFGDIVSYISQIKTFHIAQILADEKSLTQAMEDYLHKTKGNLAVLMVTDLTENSSYLFIAGEGAPLVHSAFGKKSSCIYLQNTVSSKMQIIPQLTKTVISTRKDI